MNDLFDNEPIPTNPIKLAKRDSPQTSKDAAAKVDVRGRQLYVLNHVRNAGMKGITCKEIQALDMSVPYPSISGRPADLERQGFIYFKGDRRDGARVIRAAEFDDQLRYCPSCSGVLLRFHNMECQSPKCKPRS
jgi:hypothetical protein